jgi:hypothetical protein
MILWKLGLRIYWLNIAKWSGRVITALPFLLEGPYLVVVANRHKLTLTAMIVEF